MKLNRNIVISIIIIGMLSIFGILELRDFLILKNFKNVSNDLGRYITSFDLWYGEKRTKIESTEDLVKLFNRLINDATEKKMYLRGGNYDTYVFNMYLTNGEKIYFQIKFDSDENDIFIDVQYKKVLVFQKSIVNNPEKLAWLKDELILTYTHLD